MDESWRLISVRLVLDLHRIIVESFALILISTDPEVDFYEDVRNMLNIVKCDAFALKRRMNNLSRTFEFNLIFVLTLPAGRYCHCHCRCCYPLHLLSLFSSPSLHSHRHLQCNFACSSRRCAFCTFSGPVLFLCMSCCVLHTAHALSLSRCLRSGTEITK